MEDMIHIDELSDNARFLISFSLCPECLDFLSYASWHNKECKEMYMVRCKGCGLVVKGSL